MRGAVTRLYDVQPAACLLEMRWLLSPSPGVYALCTPLMYKDMLILACNDHTCKGNKLASSQTRVSYVKCCDDMTASQEIGICRHLKVV